MLGEYPFSVLEQRNLENLTGVAEGMGKRILPYTERGKVNVFLQQTTQGFILDAMINTVQARSKNMQKTKPKKIKSINKGIKAQKIEASGIVWLENPDHYLVISDESYKSQSTLLIMNSHQQIVDEVEFPQSIEVDDLESISYDQGSLYLSSSLSHTAKGKLKKKRSQLLRFHYKNRSLTQTKSLNLYALLEQVQEQTEDPVLAGFLAHALSSKKLDIEAHAIKDQAIYLGFKDPLLHATKAVILKIEAIDRLLDGVKWHADAELAFTLPLLDPDKGKPMHLSDMLWLGDSLYLLGVAGKRQEKSALWQYNPGGQSLTCLTQFSELKAEGISFRPRTNELTVVFDLGSGKHSKYLNITLNEL